MFSSSTTLSRMEKLSETYTMRPLTRSFFLALAHMYYNYFSGRFKIRNEIIWVTGIIFGTITILEAFSGYDIILNTRAVLAVSIGVSLTYSSPVLGPTIVHTVFGGGFPDFILRFYALHIFILPIVMIVLMLVHFPRNLTFDIPIVAAGHWGCADHRGNVPVLSAYIYFNCERWLYAARVDLTGLYAFLRTFMPKFVAGILIPTLFILMFMVIPFVDKSKKFSWKDRPFFTALGIASIGQISSRRFGVSTSMKMHRLPRRHCLLIRFRYLAQ